MVFSCSPPTRVPPYRTLFQGEETPLSHPGVTHSHSPVPGAILDPAAAVQMRCAEAPGVPTISCPSLGCSAVGKDEYFGDNLILPLCLLCRNCFCALQLGRRIATSGDLKASQWAQQEADPDLFRQVPAKFQRPFPPWKSSLLFLPMPSSHVDSEELFSSPTAGNSLLHCSAGDKRLFCLERT